MFQDRVHRTISYHDTWMSLDPIVGCPYGCTYCVLRHAGNTKKRPEVKTSPADCVRQLRAHPFFVPHETCLAIGNETDMLYRGNVGYLIELLRALRDDQLRNPIILITKAPLDDASVARIRAVEGLSVLFFLSYSGLGPRYEPNFADQQLRRNFTIVRAFGFPVVHFWRPLLPENTDVAAIRRMLRFASSVADASVFVGLKLHPELSRVLVADGGVDIPSTYRDRTGEWLPGEAAAAIYREANDICPEYPLYRHSSCAIALLLGRANHTATAFRQDICPPSHCPSSQRTVCMQSRRIASDAAIERALERIGRPLRFERTEELVRIHGSVTQEEFAYLLHSLRCPLKPDEVTMENLYRGDIYSSQSAVPPPRVE